MKIVLVDYGAGNLHSAGKALERALVESGRDGEVIVSGEAAVLLDADRIVLPGDGAFRDCMTSLMAAPGMIAMLEDRVRRAGVPFLGICVGMQLLASRGLEYGETAGLDWLPGTVDRIRPTDPALKVPHMGWNTLNLRRDHPLLAGCTGGESGAHAYFLHAYHLMAEDADHVLATADYGQAVTAIVARDNIMGTQFHPEKSQGLGIRLLRNFLLWQP